MSLFTKTAVTMLLGSSMVAASPVSRESSRHTSRQSDCSAVHIITARASTEPAGEGIIGGVADGIEESNSDVSREAVDYPAKLMPYDDSSQKGTEALTEQLTAYVNECPDSQVVLLGYSQGAHIIGDVLCGGGGVPGIGDESPPISTEIGDKVAAIIQMGDPRHVAGESYDVGTAENDGLFPRREDQSCEHYASKMQSYCDDNDTFCDSGSSTSVHLAYVRNYGTDAVDFVNGLIGNQTAQ